MHKAPDSVESGAFLSFLKPDAHSEARGFVLLPLFTHLPLQSLSHFSCHCGFAALILFLLLQLIKKLPHVLLALSP